MRAVAPTLLLVWCGACGTSPRSPPAVEPAPPPSAAPPAASSVPPPPPAPVSACKEVPPGSTSDDESPVVRGTKLGREVFLDWLEARGVGRDAAIRWLAARFHVEKSRADTLTYAACGALKLGDPGEEALVCDVAVPTTSMQRHALVTVVRGKRPTAVLDVNIGMVAMDFPDARWLDLALLFDADGMSAILVDRAPDGTKLVEAPSECHAREKHDEDCDKKLAAYPNPESLAHPAGKKGERIDAIDDCMLLRGKDGRIRAAHYADHRSPGGIYPATLHDCAKGRAGLESMERDLAGASADMRNDAKRSIAFFDKTCAARGHYVWQKDHFVKTK